MGKSAFLILICALSLRAQTNSGEIRLKVSDPSGLGVKTAIHVSSAANQYRTVLQTDNQGNLVLQHLPFGRYTLTIEQSGFAPLTETIALASSIPLHHAVRLELAAVTQAVAVKSQNTLIDPDQAGSVSEIGSDVIQHRLSSIPGRSLQDLVNSQPGWLYEGNAVLHPRGSEYQTQFVAAGIPAEYGRKMGGVVELNTFQNQQAGFHGDLIAAGGSFDSASGFAGGQYTWDKNTIGASARGKRTDHYLNPVVPQNYSNTGTLGDFSLRYERDITPNDRLGLNLRHAISRYDLPNEQVQQAAGQRQTADNLETMGFASYEHIFSSFTLADVRGMVRDNANDFNSSPQSTPVEVFRHNRFRESYVKASLTG